MREHVLPWVRISDTHAWGDQGKYENKGIVTSEDYPWQDGGRRHFGPQGKPVESVNDAGVVVKRYESIHDAAQDSMVAYQSITSAMSNGNRCAGFHWRKCAK
jgi:hypothetical protein